MKKRIFSCCLAIIILVCSLSIFASARSSKTFVSCDAKIDACADGSLKVNEKWVVNYKGQFEEMVRSIETNKDNSRLSFGEITDVTVAVNGKSLTKADSGLDGTFSVELSKDSKSYDIDVCSIALDETKTYDISYTVTKAIKKEGSKARIAFCFLGDSFDGSCNNVTVEVKMPTNVIANDITIDDEEGSFFASKDDTGLVTYSAGSVYEDFVLDFSVPSTSFDVSKLATVSSVKDFFKKVLKVLEIVVPVLAFFAIVILLFVFVVKKDERERRKIEKQLVKQAKIPADASLPESMTPCQSYKLLVPYNKVNPKASSKRIPLVFAMTILECLDNGYIKMNEDNNLEICNPDTEIKPYQRSCLNFLTENSTNGVIDKNFYEKVKTVCNTRYDMLANYMISFYNLIDSVDSKYFKSTENVAQYEKVYCVKLNATKVKSTATFTSCVEKLLTGSHVTSPEIYSMLFTKKNANEFFDGNTSTSIGILSSSLNEINKVFIPKK